METTRGLGLAEEYLRGMVADRMRRKGGMTDAIEAAAGCDKARLQCQQRLGTQDGKTALMFAIEHGHAHAVRRLMKVTEPSLEAKDEPAQGEDLSLLSFKRSD